MADDLADGLRRVVSSLTVRIFLSSFSVFEGCI